MNKTSFFYYCFAFIENRLQKHEFSTILYAKMHKFDAKKRKQILKICFLWNLCILVALYKRLIPHLGSVIAKKVNGSSRNRGKTEVGSAELNRIAIGIEVVVDDEGNGIEGVRGLRLEAAVLARLGSAGLLINLVHLVCITVVGGNESYAVKLVYNLEDASELKVKSLH